MHPVRISDLTPTDLDALDALYRTPPSVRPRTRAQMFLLAAEQQLTAPEIAAIVRTSEDTVRPR